MEVHQHWAEGTRQLHRLCYATLCTTLCLPGADGGLNHRHIAVRPKTAEVGITTGVIPDFTVIMCVNARLPCPDALHPRGAKVEIAHLKPAFPIAASQRSRLYFEHARNCDLCLLIREATDGLGATRHGL